MTIGQFAKIKTLFIDRALVEGKVDRARAVLYRKVGGRTRLRAKGSIRKAPKKRRTGGRRAPFNRTGVLKQFIFFALDPQADSVVTGPVALSEKQGNVPQLLEYGGMGRVAGESVRFDEFPYMRPAFEYGLQGIDKDLKDSVK